MTLRRCTLTLALSLLSSARISPAAQGTPPLAVPSFAVQVEITLSPRAAAKLSSLHEGITVSASFAGDPNTAGKPHTNQIGQINLGLDQVTKPGRAGPVRLSGRHLFRNRLAWITGPVLLNINVFSARRSGPDNILSCDFFDGTLASAQARTLPLHCSLITENRPNRALS